MLSQPTYLHLGSSHPTKEIPIYFSYLSYIIFDQHIHNFFFVIYSLNYNIIITCKV